MLVQKINLVNRNGSVTYQLIQHLQNRKHYPVRPSVRFVLMHVFSKLTRQMWFSYAISYAFAMVLQKSCYYKLNKPVWTISCVLFLMYKYTTILDEPRCKICNHKAVRWYECVHVFVRSNEVKRFCCISSDAVNRQCEGIHDFVNVFLENRICCKVCKHMAKRECECAHDVAK